MATFYLKQTRRTGRNTAANSRHAQNCYLLACGHLENNNTDAARAMLLRALSYHSGHSATLRALVNLEFTAGDIMRAQAYLDRLLALPEPVDAQTLFVQGNIELSKGDLTGALAFYSQAEALDGSTPELAFNKGLAHLMLGHGEEATAIFTRLLEEQPENARAWDALGCALRLDKHYDKATDAFLQAVEADNKLNDARDHLAQMLLEIGETRRAVLVLDAALAIEPERESSRHLLGLTHATARDFTRAVACWEDLIAHGGTLPETYHLLANAYLHLDDRRKAAATLQTLVSLHQDHFAGHLQLAMLLLENGEYEQGWRHLEQARAIDPLNPAVTQVVAAANAMRPRRGSRDR